MGDEFLHVHRRTARRDEAYSRFVQLHPVPKNSQYFVYRGIMNIVL
jgi:hypothetical protein